MDPRVSSSGHPLPARVERLTAGPQELVVVWSEADVDAMAQALDEAGHLVAVVAPADTSDLLSFAGPPRALLLDAALLDEPTRREETLRDLDRLRADHPRTAVGMLADAEASAAAVIAGVQASVTTVVDPADPASALALVPGRERAGQRVLAIGAHPDDVEIGCGATLLGHRDRGDCVSVLTLSRGAVGGDHRQRTSEAASAASQLGAELLLGDFADTRIGDDPDLTATVEAVLAAVQPTTVYVHSAADQHQDHRAVHAAALVAARRVPQVLCYQSPSSHNGFAPTRFVPVDATMEEKVGLLAHYRSQGARHYLEPDLVVATSRYWARQVQHARYVEPFEVYRAASAD